MDKDAEEYWKLVDLWKFYLELVVKTNLFFAGISGGMIAYIFNQTTDSNLLTYSLIVPLILGVGLFAICVLGIFQSIELANSMKSLAKRISVEQPVHSSLLIFTVCLSSIFYALSSLGIIILFMFPKILYF